MRFNKKAALELSINAIVVLILAITILGLGIAFIRGQFGSLGQQFSQVAAEVKSEMVNKIKQGGENVILQRNEITMTKGGKETIYYGISNTQGENKCFGVAVRCLSGDITDCTNGNVVIGKGKNSFGTIINNVAVAKDDVGVFPMNLVTTAMTRGKTYLLEMTVVASGKAETSCGTTYDKTVIDSTGVIQSTGTGSGNWKADAHGKVQFYVIVS